MKVELPDVERALYLQVLERATIEGMTVSEMTMAWWRRALRQERTLMPMALPVEDRKVVQIRGRE